MQAVFAIGHYFIIKRIGSPFLSEQRNRYCFPKFVEREPTGRHCVHNAGVMDDLYRDAELLSVSESGSQSMERTQL